jgi:hypothetical protein
MEGSCVRSHSKQGRCDCFKLFEGVVCFVERNFMKLF